MARRKYSSPVLFNTLTPDEEDPTVVFGHSQGTTGDEFMWTFENEDLETQCFIDGYDDTDYEAMDTNHDGIITWGEYRNYQP